MGKSIALFGTSADPPTIGHEKILEELSKIYVFTISYVSNNPNKIKGFRATADAFMVENLPIVD